MIELEIKEGHKISNISDATVKNIIIEKPDSTLVTKSGSFITDGTDGLLYCRTISTDLNQAGDYNAQAYIESPNFNGYSTPITFTVYANLPLP